MINFNQFLTSKFLAVFLSELKSGSVFFYLVLLLIALFLVGVFLIARYYKKIFSHRNDALKNNISHLQDHIQLLFKEQKALSVKLTDMQNKFTAVENELSKCIEEKKKLEEENKNLKEPVQDSKKNDDIIIEYYINDNSSD